MNSVAYHTDWFQHCTSSALHVLLAGKQPDLADLGGTTKFDNQLNSLSLGVESSGCLFMGHSARTCLSLLAFGGRTYCSVPACLILGDYPPTPPLYSPPIIVGRWPHHIHGMLLGLVSPLLPVCHDCLVGTPPPPLPFLPIKSGSSFPCTLQTWSSWGAFTAVYLLSLVSITSLHDEGSRGRNMQQLAWFPRMPAQPGWTPLTQIRQAYADDLAALDLRQAAQFAAAQAFKSSIFWRGVVLVLVHSVLHGMASPSAPPKPP